MEQMQHGPHILQIAKLAAVYLPIDTTDQEQYQIEKEQYENVCTLYK